MSSADVPTPATAPHNALFLIGMWRDALAAAASQATRRSGPASDAPTRTGGNATKSAKTATTTDTWNAATTVRPTTL